MGHGLEYLSTLKKWDGKGGFRLEPMKRVLAALKDPHKEYPSIHVAGTNGKGSTCLACASILGASGAKVGLTISPHLSRVNERLVIDGIEISDNQLDSVAVELREASRKVGETLSFHEAMTAGAFLWFREEKVDFAVVEVGLGGRLDSSNVLENPAVTIITSIGYDHQDLLGNTLEEIAREKGGIIKPHSPVIIGKLPEVAGNEIKKIARSLHAPVFEYDKDFNFAFTSNLKGRHQHINISLAVKAAEILEIERDVIDDGIRDLNWPGRLEHIVYQNKSIILDCAHNLDGINSLVDYLKGNNYSKLHIGFGALTTKPWKKMVEMLIPYGDRWSIFQPPEDRGVASDDIAEYLSRFDINAVSYGSKYNQFVHNISKLDDNQLILLTGSIYFIGVVRSLLEPAVRPLWKRKV